MTELNFNELAKEIIAKLQAEDTIYLATSAHDKVTARAMAHINDGLDILFATTDGSEKIRQIRQNPNVALVVGTLRIEAVATLFGHPSGHAFFATEYPKKFPHLGDAYPERPDDILVIAKPAKMSLFKFTGKPCEDVLEPGSNRAYRVDDLQEQAKTKA